MDVGMVGGRNCGRKGLWEARGVGGREGVGSTTGMGECNGMLVYSLILMMLAWYEIKIMWCTMHYGVLHQHLYNLDLGLDG